MNITNDSYNSTQTPLLAGAVFIGHVKDLIEENFSTVLVQSFSDVAGTLVVQDSNDKSSWTDRSTIPCSANTRVSQDVLVPRRYYRVEYTNGGTNQAFFRLTSNLVDRRSLSAIYEPLNLATGDINDLEEKFSERIPASLGSGLTSNSLSVTLSSDHADVPISLSSIGDIATQTTLNQMNAKFASLGQKDKLGSVPVTLASDEDALSVSGTITANLGTIADVATQTTLNSLNGKVTACNTNEIKHKQVLSSLTLFTNSNMVYPIESECWITGIILSHQMSGTRTCVSVYDADSTTNSITVATDAPMFQIMTTTTDSASHNFTHPIHCDHGVGLRVFHPSSDLDWTGGVTLTTPEAATVSIFYYT